VLVDIEAEATADVHCGIGESPRPPRAATGKGERAEPSGVEIRQRADAPIAGGRRRARAGPGAEAGAGSEAGVSKSEAGGPPSILGLTRLSSAVVSRGASCRESASAGLALEEHVA
jgi:hypothetical protein